jgi:hypothetical protein
MGPAGSASGTRALQKPAVAARLVQLIDILVLLVTALPNGRVESANLR